MAKPVLGIDFGTSNSAAAWADEKGRVRVAAVRQDNYLLPSVCWYSPPRSDDDPGSVLVGQPARQQLIEDPKNSVFGFKRFLGLRYNSPFVHRYKDRFAYEIVEGKDGLCAVQVQGQVKPLEDVAVDVLKRLLELATVSNGSPFEECVLAVPAHFGFGQRAVIRRAAVRAGIRVKGMVNEPTAAAMYYARQKARDGTVLIFDLGGGTFDATLMAIVSGVVKVLATGGDAFLGGADFDAAIVEYYAGKLARERDLDLEGNTVAIQRITVAAEAAKIELSSADEVRVRVPCVALKEERFIDLDAKLTRAELEKLTGNLVEKCVAVCEDILKRAGVQPLEVDEVVFVGGMSRMPLIQRRLSEIFVANSQAIHPDLGVVVGTALLTQSDKSLIDVNSMSIGITMPGGVSQELVPANTPIPSVRRIAVERPAEGQPLVLGVFEAVESTSLERSVLGAVRVPPEWLKAHAGTVSLEAFLGADLEVALFLVSATGEKLPLELLAPQDAPVVSDPSLAHPGFRSISAAVSPPPARTPVPSLRSEQPTPVLPRAAVKRDAPPAAVPASPQDDKASDPEEASAPQPGEIVGGYMLLDVIGRGGMGRVYLAEHTRLGRRVALKMLRKRMGKNPTAVERFLSEARAVNQIRHENIIDVVDLFETEDGHTCTIMELLEGRSLAGLLKSVRTVRPERAVRIGFQVAAAMVAVHDAHIIHRDIKPENIFLTSKAGRDDFVKLLDFGVAKLIDVDGKSVHDTGIGITVGTRDYMSPEQLVGTGVDHRADIFSLGVVLYEIVTGRRPFISDTDRGMLFAQLEKPAPPSSKHAVPADLSTLILQMLENNMDKRPQTMREVKGRLETIAESLAGARLGNGAREKSASGGGGGGIDPFALERKDDVADETSPERMAVSLSDDSLPEVDDIEVIEATAPFPPSVGATGAVSAPPRRGVHPALVMALMALSAVAAVAIALNVVK
ncbi:MAG TPA: Hsp70 family protein [Myxococcota bacterium]